MKRALLTVVLSAALGTSAMAQGIEPVAVTPATDVTVGTLNAQAGVLIAIVAGAVVIAGLAAGSSDGSN